MIFTFEHMHVDRKKGDVNGRWALKPMDLPELKRILAAWQKELRGKGWNALYFENHDRARVISRWGNDAEYRYECATAFATILHGLQGTPFIFQGEEIGMTNPAFELDEYEDIELRGNYHFYVEQQKTMSKSEFLAAVHKISRDNARTPMQWEDSDYAGFSKVEPWFKINPNYPEVNAALDQKSKKSVFSYYQKLIELRHTEEILTEGEFELLYEEDSKLFVYKRNWKAKTWIVIANMSETEQQLPKALDLSGSTIVLKNYAEREKLTAALAPYEALIIQTV
jgi:oligo-1,6-glucosidase